ncbi:ribbon-helix-helix domain-containing protein [Brachyspira innocens]|uniref:Ribbon-helix-helix domain-containing protein n=1 Tax=Brachyspira innocens TaxID=13264 RepID=A0ABT8YTR3_9SPIR|nr:ribbon-helix-helix domain-containing protein [Brachyspira innocens]MDO6992912.1 ribbon-helix-helix domain-containing protein [Brachyspira innocens]MDO7019177.1 ribbon-helix-helix domain-containing protein [Brachyspira innocens]
MDNEEKNTHGGARAGAGRKKKEVKAKRKGKVVYFRILDDNYALLEKISNENNLTVNKYVQKIVMEKIETVK